jgi:hypothetical protein
MTDHLAALRQATRWCVWKYAKAKGGRTTKVPFVNHTVKAKSDDPGTWQAYDQLPLGNGFAGPGIMLGDELQGVDLDACLHDGVLEPWAAEVVDRLDTYAEISPSGRGIKCLFYGPPGASAEVSFGDPVDVGGDAPKRRELALFTGKRFFAVTARTWRDRPLRTISSDDAAWLRDRVEALRDAEKARKTAGKPKVAPKSRARPGGQPGALPAALLTLIAEGAPEGWRSEKFHHAVCWCADLGMAEVDIVALLERHPDGIAAKYTGRLAEEVKRCLSKRQASEPKSDPVELRWDDFPEFPPDIKFVIPGWMPDGVVTLFAAHGGTGKSFLSLLIALCLATGRHPFEPGLSIPRRKVLLYSAEDDLTVMRARLWRYMRLMDIKPADLDGWLLILDATQSDNVLFSENEKVGARTTARFTWLGEQVAEFGAQVLIFDNASDAADINENDRAKVRQFMASLKRLARAVLLLAHVDAASSMASIADAKGYSGNTGWHNNARSRWFMARDGDDILLTLPKVNYAKAGAQAVIRWSDSHGVFEVIGTREGNARAADNRNVLLILLDKATTNGVAVSPAVNTTASVWNTVKCMDGCPSGLKSSDVAKEVMRWRTEGLVTIETKTRPNRTKQEVLALTDKGRHLCRSGADSGDFT